MRAKATASRSVACEVLIRVERDQAFASLALSAQMSRANLSARDKAFATELVYGVLRHRGRLDYLIGCFSKKPVHRLSPYLRQALLIAAYQIIHLSSVPPEVACSESVLIVKQKEPWATGYANAVCRSFLRGYEQVTFPGRDRDPVDYISKKHSHPEWLVKRWINHFGEEETLTLCEANNERPPLTLRVNPLKTTVEALIDTFQKKGIDATRGLYAPRSIILRGAGPVQNLPFFEDGYFQVQDESSQLVSSLMDPQPGERIVEMCAGPGGKITAIAESLLEKHPDATDLPRLQAYEIHDHQAALIEENAKRLGVASLINIEVLDARNIPSKLDGKWDKVLLDAPCSGTGVIRRRPDIKWHLKQSDFKQLVSLQRELMGRATDLVAPGGTIVYSTCSIDPEENDDQAIWFFRTFPKFRQQGHRHFFPHIHDTDGFYMMSSTHIH